MSGGAPLLASTAFAPRLSLWECAPCAIWHHLCHSKSHATRAHSSRSVPNETRPQWTSYTAQFAVEAAAGAVLMGGASAVLVPSSLVSYIETRWQRVEDQCERQCTSSARSRYDDMYSPPGNTDAAQGGRMCGNCGSTRQDSVRSATRHPNPTSAILKSWRTLQSEQRLIVLLPHDHTKDFLAHFPHYTQLCIPVPGGSLAAQRLFATSLDAFYAQEVPHLADTVAYAGPHHQWYAWVRGALTCRYEGTYKFPVTLAELTTQLLRAESSYTAAPCPRPAPRDSECVGAGTSTETKRLAHSHRASEAGGFAQRPHSAKCEEDGVPLSRRGRCRGVVWESAIAGMTPRWLETTLKTAMSCGVSCAEDGLLTLALPSAASCTALMYKALDMRVTQFATCSLARRPIFTDTQALTTLEEVMELAVGCNDCASGGVSVKEERGMTECRSFVDALSATWQQELGTSARGLQTIT